MLAMSSSFKNTKIEKEFIVCHKYKENSALYVIPIFVIKEMCNTFTCFIIFRYREP
jgi:hypothetical protein